MNQNQQVGNPHTQTRKNRLPDLKGLGNQKINPDVDLKNEKIGQSKTGLKSAYTLANYTTAVQYLHSRSYAKKIIQENGQPEYELYEVCVDTIQLKQYGLGAYLYLEFIKRLAVAFVIMSSIYILPIVQAYMNGTGLSNYKQSYMIIIAKTSLGNIKDGNQMSYILFTITDLLSMLVLFIFYLHWKNFHKETVSEENKSPEILNPSIYSLSVVGFDPKTPNLERKLQDYFNRVMMFGKQISNKLYNNPMRQEELIRPSVQTYQVSLVYKYQGEFSKFLYYDQLVEKREKQIQIMTQTNKNNQDLLKIQQQITQIEQQLSKISEDFQPYQAIIHFQTIKSKHQFIRFCRNYALLDNLSYALKRIFCCQHLPPKSKLFMEKDALMIKNMNLSRPEQINWPNLDISSCSRLLRWFFSILLVLISILITSSLIAVCTLYVSSQSACTNFDPLTSLAAALLKGNQTLYCYCAAHFTEIYTDINVSNACNELSNTILYANVMQIGASLVSSVSNILLIFAVGLISKKVLKPDSRPKEYSFMFVGVLFSNYINASVLPLILNGDIYGFQSLKYLTFLNFIDFSRVAIFKDFTIDWYAVVGPYYINFMLIAIISPIIDLIICCLKGCYLNHKVKKACQNVDQEDPMIQKQANKLITSMQFDIAIEKAIICLNTIISIMYSSLIPILVPIAAIYLIISFICKKIILLRYSIRIPANEALSEKAITLFPFILFLHFLMGVWAHTANDVFNSSSYLINVQQKFVDIEIGTRAFKDILMLGGLAAVAVWIILNFTIVSFFVNLSECCEKQSDQIILPNDLANKQNRSFRAALRSANILGSYKLVNNPEHGHAIQAYKQLKRRTRKQNPQQQISPEPANLKKFKETLDTFGDQLKNSGELQQFGSSSHIVGKTSNKQQPNNSMSQMPMIQHPMMMTHSAIIPQNMTQQSGQPIMYLSGQNFTYQNLGNNPNGVYQI